MEDELQEQAQNSPGDRIKPWQFKKGQSGNPNGRPAGKSLKERAKAMLNAMTPEEEQEFLEGIDKRTIWEMAEGKAKNDIEFSGSINISNVLNDIENERPKTNNEIMENQPPLQDTRQKTEPNQV